MISRTTKDFWKFYERLPDQIKKKAKDAFKRFQEDPYHPSLHFKRIHSSKPIFSVRVTKDYRVIGVTKGEIIIWFWIGSHNDYEKIIKRVRRVS